MTGTEPTRDEFTQLLGRAGRGDAAAVNALVPLVYGELRALASRYMRKERAGHTLQTTALIHEAYLKLVDQSEVEWTGRAHFLAVAATSVRRILIDHARRHQAGRRAHEREHVVLDEVDVMAVQDPAELLAIHDALTRFAEIYPRKSQVVELKFFAGLDIEETAKVLGASTATVERDWRLARAWLHRELHPDEGD